MKIYYIFYNIVFQNITSFGREEKCLINGITFYIVRLVSLFFVIDWSGLSACSPALDKSHFSIALCFSNQ